MATSLSMETVMAVLPEPLKIRLIYQLNLLEDGKPVF